LPDTLCRALRPRREKSLRRPKGDPAPGRYRRGCPRCSPARWTGGPCRGRPPLPLLFFGELRMRGRGRMERQRPGVPDVGQVGEQLEPLDELLSRGAPPPWPEDHHSAEALLQGPRGHGMRGVARQAGIAHPGHLRMPREMLRRREGVGRMQRHADVQRLDPLQEDPGVVGGKAGAQVAQRHRPEAEGEGDLPQFRWKVDGPAEAVVVPVRAGEQIGRAHV
jgi:hypothetical protein